MDLPPLHGEGDTDRVFFVARASSPHLLAPERAGWKPALRSEAFVAGEYAGVEFGREALEGAGVGGGRRGGRR